MNPSKAKRVGQIEQCLIAIGEHFNVQPERVLSNERATASALRSAQSAFWTHLKTCGYTKFSICGMTKRSDENIRIGLNRGTQLLLGPDRPFIESLPKIDLPPGDTLTTS